MPENRADVSKQSETVKLLVMVMNLLCTPIAAELTVCPTALGQILWCRGEGDAQTEVSHHCPWIFKLQGSESVCTWTTGSIARRRQCGFSGTLKKMSTMKKVNEGLVGT